MRNGLGIVASLAVALALFAGAVFYAQQKSERLFAAPMGYCGLEFTALTPAAAARTPLLKSGGALVYAVDDHSPAARAGIKPGAVIAAIDGVKITSARQASDMVRAKAPGTRALLTLFDVTSGKVRPEKVALTFDAVPEPKKSFSVMPPRTLTREYFPPSAPAANAAWSPRILRGPTIKPEPLTGLGAGQCNGFAPPGWHVVGHAPDNSLFRVAADEGFAHAIFQSGARNGATAQGYIRAWLEKTFGSPAMLTPPQPRPFGFEQRDFGNAKGGAGFVVSRVTGNRIALWVGAVPGADVAWAKPLVGAVALSLSCAAPDAPKPQPRASELLATRISTACIQGQCRETDFAATYLTVLRKGYVHNAGGEMFLVVPKRDFWQTGAEGPGFYHQIGGENEKLEPGRIN